MALSEEMARQRDELLRLVAARVPVRSAAVAARVVRISPAVLVHTNGLGSLFHSLTHPRTSRSSSTTLRCAARLAIGEFGEPAFDQVEPGGACGGGTGGGGSATS